MKQDMLVRVRNEKELYNRGIDRKRYDAHFGRVRWGPGSADIRKKNIVSGVLEKGKGKNVLELGSTSWHSYVDFQNYAPDRLTCINISEKELEKGIALSAEMDTGKYCRHDFKVMDAHNLEFPDGTFDIVFGEAILHHLNFGTAVRELYRVLKPDGEIVFVEPLARNPVGKLVRRLTPDARTPDEKPLDKEEFLILRKYFNLENSYLQLFYVPAAVMSKYIFKKAKNPVMYAADRLDCFLERMFRKTNFCLYYRIVVIKGFPKKKNHGKRKWCHGSARHQREENK